MEKIATVWRKSIYKNNYKCKCGHKLSENGDEPDHCLIFAEMQEMVIKSKPWSEVLSPCFCPKCHKIVGYMQKVDVPEDIAGAQGSLQEFMNKKMRS